MNKYFLGLLLVLILKVNFNIVAQTGKGETMVGIDLSGLLKRSTQKQATQQLKINDKRKLNLQGDLRLGYFFLNNLCIGINPEISYASSLTSATEYVNPASPASTTYSTTRSIQRINLISFNPFIRFYVIRHNSFGVFLEGGAGPTFAKVKDKNIKETMNGDKVTSTETSDRESIFNTKLGLGLNYFFSPRAGIELSLFYQHYNIKKLQYVYDLYKGNTTAFIGFNYYF